MAPRVFDMRKGSDMDRQRFHHLLEAYGANLDRWPAGEREAAAAFAAAHAGEYECAMADARELDMALNSRRGADEPASDLLSARILSAYKRQRGAGAPWRAAIALAARRRQAFAGYAGNADRCKTESRNGMDGL